MQNTMVSIGERKTQRYIRNLQSAGGTIIMIQPYRTEKPIFTQ